MKKLLTLLLLFCAVLQADASETWTDETGITWTYTLDGNSLALIFQSSQTTGDLVFPSVVNGYTVGGVSAFSNSSWIRKFSIGL